MKIIIILPFIAMLGACFQDSTKADIDDRSKIDAIAIEQATFEWKKADAAAINAVNAEQQEFLKANDFKFRLYFAYDDSSVSKDSIEEIAKHIKFMQENPEVGLTLKGHADQRGTREYNLALGENRALAVKKAMGSDKQIISRIEVVSYGEENPHSKINNEAGWKLNRRVEFIYK